jgi:hypothetical protein
VVERALRFAVAMTAVAVSLVGALLSAGLMLRFDGDLVPLAAGLCALGLAIALLRWTLQVSGTNMRTQAVINTPVQPRARSITEQIPAVHEARTGPHEPKTVSAVHQPPPSGGGVGRWTPLITTCWRGYTHIVALMGRVNVLSATGTVSPRHEAVFLVGVPVATFGIVLFLTNQAGVAYSPHCNSATNFAASLFFLPTSPSTCQSVPFLSDVPTVILSFASPFAFVAYRLIRRRLSSLLDALAATGLIVRQGPTSPIVQGVQRLTRAIDLTPTTRVALFLTCGALTVWLYSRNLRGGHIFTLLSTVDPSGVSNVEALRSSWWANYHHYPFLAFLCVFIGSVGVYYAIRAAWLYLWLGAVLYATRRFAPDLLPLDYVPRWRDKSYGWSPVTGLLVLIYFSAVNFAISMVAVFDMVRNETAALLVAASFATLGVVTNLVIILTPFFRMLAAHRAVEERLRARLERASTGESDTMTVGQYVVATTDLLSWRRIPVSSISGSAIKVIPGLYAFVQIVITFPQFPH